MVTEAERAGHVMGIMSCECEACSRSTGPNMASIYLQLVMDTRARSMRMMRLTTAQTVMTILRLCCVIQFTCKALKRAC